MGSVQWEGEGLDQLLREVKNKKNLRLICHYIINVMETTQHIYISQIRFMAKTVSILIFAQTFKFPYTHI